MANYKPYDKYYLSNDSWFGELPSHWEIRKTKHLFNLICEQAPANNSLELLSIYTAIGVRPRRQLEARGNKATTTDNYWIVKKQDIIVNKLLAWMGAIGISEYDGVTSPAYDILRSKDGVNPYFYNYLFRTSFASKEFKRHSRGIMDVRLRLYFSEFGNIYLPFPDYKEQTTIARFLDYKLAKINRFIQKKKQLIKLLNEQKAAIINQAVTKGLDPNAKMKDSGIEWLGVIPEDWEKYKLKYLISKPIAGAWGTEPQNDDNDITCIRVADFKEYEIKTENLTIRNIEAKSEQILRPGDLLLEKSGGGEKTPVGRVVLFNQSFKAVTSNFVSKFSPKTELVSSEYLLYIFKLINSVRWNFRSLKQTTGIQNIDTYQYMDNWVFIPKIEEQRTIINHIKNEFKVLDETISKIEKELALTEEYKTALIAEAVTGKIDVRGYEVPELSEEETYEEIEEEISMAAEDAEEYEIIEE